MKNLFFYFVLNDKLSVHNKINLFKLLLTNFELPQYDPTKVFALF